MRYSRLALLVFTLTLVTLAAKKKNEEDKTQTVVRIISAQRADRKERRFYEDENG